jgi:hypothetical protein
MANRLRWFKKEGDCNRESFIIDKKALREMPRGQAQGRFVHNLR